MPTRIHWHYPAVVLFTFLLLLGACLGYLGIRYQNRYYPGSQVAGFSLAGKTPAEAKALLDGQIQAYLQHPVVLSLPDIQKPRDPLTHDYPQIRLNSTAQAIGLSFSPQPALDQAWAAGHPGQHPISWLKGIYRSLVQGDQPLPYTISSSQVKSFIFTNVVPKITTPQPATLKVSGSLVVVVPSAPGLQVDQTALTGELINSLSVATDRDTTYLRVPVQQVDSPVTQAVIQPLADSLNSLGDLKLTLTAGSSSTSPSRVQLLSWFQPVQDEQGHLSLSLNKPAVAQYLAAQANLDQAASLDTLTKSLNSVLAVAQPPASLNVALVAKPVVVTPISTSTDFTPGKFSGKYVEVNLTEQRMYLVDSTSLVKSYIVSTGFWTTPTPTGTFAIHDKTPRAYSAEFGLYMPWWEDFLGGAYGLHELPEWPNGYKEGQNHLGTPVSHGCVRLGIGDAKEVYDWTDIGTPVYIH